jgi:hypothetical protein
VHGRNVLWVGNLESAPEVRIKMSGRWRDARATVHKNDDAVGRRLNVYARIGPTTLGRVLVRVELE